jgi:hypothetical protein
MIIAFKLPSAMVGFLPPPYQSSFENGCLIEGHVRTLPRLVKAPFQYVTYACKYVDVAKKLTNKPIKQAVITASALSMVYTPHLLKERQIPNYSREQFLKDLIDECEKDIRLCLGESQHSFVIDEDVCVASRTRCTYCSIGFH